MYDEAGAFVLDSVINANGELAWRNLPGDPYGAHDATVAGPKVERIEITAKKDASDALTEMAISVSATDQIDAATVAEGLRLDALDAEGTVLRSAPNPPQLFDNRAVWKFPTGEWTAFVAGAESIAIRVTSALRSATWGGDVAFAASDDSDAADSSRVDARVAIATTEALVGRAAPGGSATTTVYEASLVGAVDGEDSLLQLGTAVFHAYPFVEPASGKIYARARWYDARSGRFMSPDPMRYQDSSDMYAIAGADPVNRRDPRGESYWEDRVGELQDELIEIYRLQQQNPDRFFGDVIADLRVEIEVLQRDRPSRAPGEPSLFAKAARGAAKWVGLGDNAEQQCADALDASYPTQPVGDPEITTIIPDRGRKLQDVAFRDIGCRGLNFSVQLAQGGVEAKLFQALAAGGAVFATYGSRATGKEAERFIIDDLVRRGYSDVFSLQNASGHGIDIIARNRRGKLRFFEVKSTQTGLAGRLSLYQQNPDQFVRDRLRSTVEAKGQWKGTSEEVRAFAQDVLDELGDVQASTVRANVRYPRPGVSGAPQVNYSRWRRK